MGLSVVAALGEVSDQLVELHQAHLKPHIQPTQFLQLQAQLLVLRIEISCVILHFYLPQISKTLSMRHFVHV